MLPLFSFLEGLVPRPLDRPQLGDGTFQHNSCTLCYHLLTQSTSVTDNLLLLPLSNAVGLLPAFAAFWRSQYRVCATSHCLRAGYTSFLELVEAQAQHSYSSPDQGMLGCKNQGVTDDAEVVSLSHCATKAYAVRLSLPKGDTLDPIRGYLTALYSQALFIPPVSKWKFICQRIP